MILLACSFSVHKGTKLVEKIAITFRKKSAKKLVGMKNRVRN